MSAQIPVFASVPSKLNAEQAASKRFIYHHLRDLLLEPRTVGGSDYSHFNPLREVRTLAEHCAGGIILGYRQIWADAYRNRDDEVRTDYAAPTAWNHLETGVLFGLGLPLLVLREGRIEGGIFDAGASDIFIHEMPMPGALWDPAVPSTFTGDVQVGIRFRQAVLRWQAMVRTHYYDGR